MIYKIFTLTVMFILALGVNQSKAQDEPCNCPCDCIDAITDAVNAVMETSWCDADQLWEAPHSLEVQLKKLQNWCGGQNKPLKSKIPNIVQAMLEIIEDAYAGESYTDPLSGEVIVVSIPAPDCAMPALEALQSLLEDGCPATGVE